MNINLISALSDLSFAEYGILGTVATVAISGMVYMFKKYHDVQESRLKEKDIYTKDLLDYLDKMLNSNSALKDLVKNTSITDKGAILSKLELSTNEITAKIEMLKINCDVKK